MGSWQDRTHTCTSHGRVPWIWLPFFDHGSALDSPVLLQVGAITLVGCYLGFCETNMNE